MTRVKCVMGIVVAGTIVASEGLAVAQQPRNDACGGCDVTFSVAITPEGSRLTAVGGDGVIVDKRMDRQGLSISVSSSTDVIEIAAATNGTVTVARKGKVVTVEPGSVLRDYEAAVRELTADSAAVNGLERMVMALRHSERPEALSVLASFALIRALHGDDTGNTLLAQRTPKRRHSRLLQIAQHQRGDETTVGDCWAEYERTLDRNYARYSQCLRDFWWNQPVQYACGLEFAMVAELALFRVIACAGGFPIG